MRLIEKIQDWYTEESSPPYLDGVELVSEEIVDTARWGNVTEFIFRENNEYVMVRAVAPATEMQGWGDYGDPDIHEVEPYEVTVTKYRVKSDGGS